MMATQNNLAQHIDIVENRSLAAHDIHDEGPGNQENFEQMNQTEAEVSESQPVLQVNQGLPDAGQEPAWAEPSNQELPSNNQSEQSANQMQPFESGDTDINQSEVSNTESSEQPAYDLLGDLGAVVAPSFNHQSGGNEQEAE